MSRYNIAEDILERMRDGRAHDDAMLLLTSCVEQARTQFDGRPWDPALFLAQANLIANDGENDGPEALGRLGAAVLDFGSIAATSILALLDGLGYDADAFIAGLALVRPPFYDEGAV